MEFWQKEWLIFKSKEVELYWRISYIDVLNKKLYSSIRTNNIKITRGNKSFYGDWSMAHHTTYDWYTNSCRPIPLENSDYRQETFLNNILGTCLKVIEQVEKEMIKSTYEYEQARDLEDEAKERLTQIAEDFLDEEGVTNDDIREAYIDSYVDKNLENYRDDVVSKSKFRFFKTAYLHLCSWFGDKERFEDYMKEIKKKSKIKEKYIYKIWKDCRAIQTEEWKEEMAEQLESI